MQKRPFSIIVLGFFAIVAIFQNVYLLKNYLISLNYVAFEKVGISWIFFIIEGIFIILDILILWFIWKPKIIGFWIGISNTTLSLINKIVLFLVAFQNISGFKEFFITARKSHGLTLNQASVDKIFSREIIIYGLIWGIICAIVFGFLLIKNKKYFKHGLAQVQEKISKNYPTIKNALFLVFLFLAVEILIVGVVSEFFKEIYEQNETFFIFIISFVGTGLPIYIGFRKTHIKLKELFQWKKLDWHFLIPIGILIFSFTMIVLQLIHLIDYFLPIPDIFKEINQKLIRNELLSFLIVVIVAPVMEEIFFRGLILNGFLKNYSIKKALIISSIFFAAVHLNPWTFIIHFFMGIFLGWIYIKTKNLIHSILFHAGFNSIPFIIIYFTNIKIQESSHVAEALFLPLWLNVIGVILLGISVYWLNKTSKKGMFL